MNVLDTAEEISWEPQKEESEATSWQYLYFSKAIGFFSSRIKEKEMMTAKLENYFFVFGILAIFQWKQKKVSCTLTGTWTGNSEWSLHRSPTWLPRSLPRSSPQTSFMQNFANWEISTTVLHQINESTKQTVIHCSSHLKSTNIEITLSTLKTYYVLVTLPLFKMLKSTCITPNQF